ncbi:MAG: penicillin-binding protein 2, partial [Magnetococcales bacterium]|nr:penicillin-binding protein 2 [Magnetococcales bacterium]
MKQSRMKKRQESSVREAPIRRNRRSRLPKKKRGGLFTKLFPAPGIRASKGSSRTPPEGGRTPPPEPGSYIRSRLDFLVGLFFLAFFILGLRAVDLAIFQHQKLSNRAQRQHEKKVTLPAFRGQFFDRNGRTLAISLPVQSLSVDMSRVESPVGLARVLAPYLNISQRQLIKKLTSARANSFPTIRRKLPPPVTQKIRALDEPSVFFIPEMKRFYPAGEITSHALGFVDIDGKGVEGLEAALDNDLQGQAGMKLIAQDRLGRPMFPVAQTLEPAKPGTDVSLTIDATVQYITYRALLKGVSESKARAGIALVMNPKNGDVLAMVNQPGFNPNNMANSTASSRRNRAITDAFEPGSTFKIFTIAAAMDSDLVSPGTWVDIGGGVMKIGPRVIRDTHSKRKPKMTVRQILQKSSNVGAAKIGLMLGHEAQEHYLRSFGFGRRSGVELSYESSGQFPDITHYKKIGVANRAYGYGITATPLQLVTAASAAINGGLLYEPHMVSGYWKDGKMIPIRR